MMKEERRWNGCQKEKMEKTNISVGVCCIGEMLLKM